MESVEDNSEMLDSVTRRIPCQFGSSCEVVPHDLTLSYDQTIVTIYNDHVTERKIGGGGTNAGLEILQGTVMPEDQYGYINYTKDGGTLRTSSKYFRGEDGRVEGGLCINLGITGLLIGKAAMKALGGHGVKTNIKEVSTSSVGELLGPMIQGAVQSIRKQLSVLTKEDKVAVVRYLDEKGTFLIKKSVEKITDFPGVSRFTVYNYPNEPRQSKRTKESGETENGTCFDQGRVGI